MLGFKFKPINLKIKGYDYGKSYNETSDEDYVMPMYNVLEYPHWYKFIKTSKHEYSSTN